MRPLILRDVLRVVGATFVILPMATLPAAVTRIFFLQLQDAGVRRAGELWPHHVGLVCDGLLAEKPACASRLTQLLLRRLIERIGRVAHLLDLARHRTRTVSLLVRLRVGIGVVSVPCGVGAMRSARASTVQRRHGRELNAGGLDDVVEAEPVSHARQDRRALSLAQTCRSLPKHESGQLVGDLHADLTQLAQHGSVPVAKSSMFFTIAALAAFQVFLKEFRLLLDLKALEPRPDEGLEDVQSLRALEISRREGLHGLSPGEVFESCHKPHGLQRGVSSVYELEKLHLAHVVGHFQRVSCKAGHFFRVHRPQPRIHPLLPWVALCPLVGTPRRSRRGIVP